MATEYFVLLESLDLCCRRPKTLNATTQASVPPNSANPLIMGEWFDIDATVASEQWKRATGALPAFPYYLPMGEPTPQITHKIPLLLGNGYEFDTKVFTAAGITIGAPVKVSAAVMVGGLAKSGLILHTGAADADFVQGHCVRLAANNNGFLRVHRMGPYRIA